MATKSTIFKPKTIGGYVQTSPRRPKKRPRLRKPPLSIQQILAWADAHYERTGKWPTRTAGRVYDVPDQTWQGVCRALNNGGRGLPGGSSLAELLAKQRGKRNRLALPRLAIKQVLAWADAYHQRTGRWPTHLSGSIPGSPGETWGGIHNSLIQGRRGLPSRMSLARLLSKHRQVRNIMALPRLSIEQLLKWADAYHRRTGRWPTTASGPVAEAPGESWNAISSALYSGCRGFSAGLSLRDLLVKFRGTPKRRTVLPVLTVEQVLAWADEHRRKTCRWPRLKDPVHAMPGFSWSVINTALIKGHRGLPGKLSLRKLLTKYRGAPKKIVLPPLTIEQLLAWADAHHRRIGRWPTQSSRLHGLRGGTWGAVDLALARGYHGLPGGTTLRQLLVQHGRIKQVSPSVKRTR